MKQLCTIRAGNPKNVLLTSRHIPKYFYQCSVESRDSKLNSQQDQILYMVPILATRKTAFDPPHPFMMKAGASSPVEGGLNPNPILALIANRSSQLFGFLRPVNPAPVASPGFLDLPTILMLQNNILAMLNNNNIRQVGFFRFLT